MILLVKAKKNGFQLIKRPIPLEDALFIDKPESILSKNMFYIYHLPSEAYKFQGNTQFDKTSFLQEMESARQRFTALHHEMELGYARTNFDKYKSPETLEKLMALNEDDSHLISEEDRSRKVHSRQKSEKIFPNIANTKATSWANSLSPDYTSKRLLALQTKPSYEKSKEDLIITESPLPGSPEKISSSVLKSKITEESKKTKQLSRLSRLTLSMSTILQYAKPNQVSSATSNQVEPLPSDKSLSASEGSFDRPRGDTEDSNASLDAIKNIKSSGSDIRYHPKKTFRLLRKENP